MSEKPMWREPGPWKIERNARLIAAAPELAEALVLALRELRCCRDQLAAHGMPSRQDGSVNLAIQNGANALAKAGAL